MFVIYVIGLQIQYVHTVLSSRRSIPTWQTTICSQQSASVQVYGGCRWQPLNLLSNSCLYTRPIVNIPQRDLLPWAISHPDSSPYLPLSLAMPYTSRSTLPDLNQLQATRRMNSFSRISLSGVIVTCDFSYNFDSQLLPGNKERLYHFVMKEKPSTY